MIRGEWFVLLIVALIALGLWAGFTFLSRQARLERRRRKSHGRVIPKSNRLTVRFSVRTPKK